MDFFIFNEIFQSNFTKSNLLTDTHKIPYCSEIYNHYSNCITVGVEENKITTTAEIANKFNRSSYKKDSDNLYSFDFTHFKKLVTALLANQPEEDVKDFCDNIKGEIIINYDEFYERILNGLMDYYKSDEYLTKLAKYEKMSQPTMETASFEYSFFNNFTYIIS